MGLMEIEDYISWNFLRIRFLVFQVEERRINFKVEHSFIGIFTMHFWKYYYVQPNI